MTIDACAAKLEMLTGCGQRLGDEPADLLFWLLEQRLCQLAVVYDSAVELLQRTYTEHADYLLWRGREREVGQLAGRAIELAASRKRHDTTLMHAVMLSGKAQTQSLTRGTWMRGVQFLAQWTNVAREVGSLPTLYRDMADYAGEAGETDAGLTLINLSRRAVPDGPNAERDTRLADTVRARLLRKDGRAREALRHVQTDENVEPGLRVLELINAAQVHLDVRDRAAAEHLLAVASQLIHQHGFAHLQPNIDRVFARL
jgi:hypothetical protein